MKTVYLDNDWEFIWPGTRQNTSTGEEEDAAGLAGLTARFSLTKGGATIHADLSKSLAERATTAGEYFAIADGDVLRTHLLAYAGLYIWEVFGDGTNVLYSVQRKVMTSRQP